MISQHQSKEANWRSCKTYLGTEFNNRIKAWLLDEGSLTQRLTKASNGHFRVQVRQQQWEHPLPSESRLLAMRSREVGLVREVTLMCHEQPWVFARSVIPFRSTRGHLRYLRRWADDSLGALLFKDPGMHRKPFEIARIHADQGLLPDDLQSEQSVWGRRSLFYLRHQPLLVCEIFLPAFQSSLIV